MGKCIECGIELSGRKKHCPECYQKRVNEKAKQAYAEKHSDRRCKKCGKPVEKYQQLCPECKSTRWKDCNSYQTWLRCINEQADIKRREFIETYDFGELEYVGGFTTGNCDITLRCKTCGSERTLTIDGARSAVNGHNAALRCFVCHPSRKHPRYTQSEWFEVQRQRGAEQRAATQARKELEKLERIREKQARKEQKEQEKLEKIRTVECAVCGKTFQTTQPNQKTCSKECGKKRRNRRNDYKVPKEAVVDRDITLATLYKRDEGICYICGCTCDWNDIYRNNGYVITGGQYPSVDHVIPVSRGGKHAWSNVRLACRNCNSKKSDIELAEFLGTTDAVSESTEILKPVTRKNGRKAVMQYTKKGDVIGKYESAADAARKTGFKARQIQNSARGGTKSYRGFVWEYV